MFSYLSEGVCKGINFHIRKYSFSFCFSQHNTDTKNSADDNVRTGTSIEY